MSNANEYFDNKKLGDRLMVLQERDRLLELFNGNTDHVLKHLRELLTSSYGWSKNIEFINTVIKELEG